MTIAYVVGGKIIDKLIVGRSCKGKHDDAVG